MLEYNRIDILEDIDTNKTSASKECNICHYWCFIDKNLNYGKYLCNILMMLLLYLLKEVITEFIFGI